MKVMIGSGAVVHEGRKIGVRYYALCGAKANRTGSIVRSGAFPVAESCAVTCKKCQAKLVEQERAKEVSHGR